MVNDAEERLAAAINAAGPVSADDQLAAVRRMLEAGRALSHPQRDDRDLDRDLLERVRAAAG